jgi:hypothetical protein
MFKPHHLVGVGVLGLIILLVLRSAGKPNLQKAILPDTPISIMEAVEKYGDTLCQEDPARTIIKISLTPTKATITNTGTKVGCVNAFVVSEGEILTDHPNVVMFVAPKSTKEISTSTGDKYAFPFNRFISISSLKKDWK